MVETYEGRVKLNLEAVNGFQIKAPWQVSKFFDFRNIKKLLKPKLWHIVTVIISGREAQALKRIQICYNDRLIDEFTKAGKRIAKEDVNVLENY